MEGGKIFKGRVIFRVSLYHFIYQYRVNFILTDATLLAHTKEYVLACYEKEIYYHNHATTSDIDSDLFRHTSLDEFVQ